MTWALSFLMEYLLHFIFSSFDLSGERKQTTMAGLRGPRIEHL